MTKQQEVLAVGNFSGQMQELFGTALVVAQERFQNGYVSAEHFLWAIAHATTTNGHKLFLAAGGDVAILLRGLSENLELSPVITSVHLTHGAFSLPLTRDGSRILEKARQIAKEASGKKIGSDHLLLALLKIERSRVVLVASGVNPEKAQEAFEQIHQADQSEPGDGTILELSDLVEEAQRHPLIITPRVRMGLQALRRNSRLMGVILIGEDGCPVWDQILGLALGIEANVPSQTGGLVAIRPGAFLANPILTMQAAIQSAMRTESILVIPEIERYAERASGYAEAGDLLGEAMLNRGLKVIGLTSITYRTILKEDRIFSKMRVVEVEPASIEETEAYLRALVSRLTEEGLQIAEPSVVNRLVAYAEQYLPGELPGSAINLLYEVWSSVPQDAPDQPIIVDDDLVIQVLERLTNLPLGRLIGDERERLAKMEETIHTRFINQEEAVTAVSRAVRRGRTNLRSKRGPIGSFLFLGPTGTGKTQLAKTLAWFLFGDEEALIEIDMTGFQEQHTASALLGAPQGYEGTNKPTQLSVVKQKPYSVVLFDEIEKAHPDVWMAIMEALWEGFLVLRNGERINFRHAIIIMTSNVGSARLVGQDVAQEQTLALEDLRGKFPPEFLNRIGRIIPFVPFKQAELQQIFGLQFNQAAKSAADEGITLRLDPNASRGLIASLAEECAYRGARPIERAVARFIELVTDGLFNDQYVTGQTIEARFINGQLEPVIVADK